MNLPVSPFSSTSPCIRIESAGECDGSICHQPIFNDDGGLNYVAPHFHLVEWDASAEKLRHYAIFGISERAGTKNSRTR